MSQTLKKLLYFFSIVPIFAGFLILWWFNYLDIYQTIIYGAICQVTLFIVGFGKKVWDKLEGQLVDKVAESTLSAAETIFSGPIFLRDYNKHILRKYDLYSVGEIVSLNPIKFEHIFVELSVDKSNPHEKGILEQFIQKDDIKGNHSIWEFIKHSQPKSCDGIAWAVVGAPGSGKTSLLQNIAIILAAKKGGQYKIHNLTPVTLFLREHIDPILQNVPLHRLLQELFSDEQKSHVLRQPPSNWFKDKLKSRECLVLLDGLDEIADTEKRKSVSKWLDMQISDYPKCRFIITSRPQGYHSAPLKRAKVLKINPFNSAQVKKFVNNWYLVQELEKSQQDIDKTAHQNAENKAKRLIDILLTTPALKEISVNPLLLTMIAIVHDFFGALPGSRDDLYKELCEALLEGRQKAKNIDDRWSKEQKLAILRPLASYMMERQQREISYKEMRKIVDVPLDSIGVSSDIVDNFLDELELRSGLLIETEAEIWRFVHLSFQEYLTAAHWLKGNIIEQNWSRMVEDSWWHETLRFYSAQADAMPIIEECEKSGTVQSLALVVAIRQDDVSNEGTS